MRLSVSGRMSRKTGLKMASALQHHTWATHSIERVIAPNKQNTARDKQQNTARETQNRYLVRPGAKDTISQAMMMAALRRL
jgi:hypothetical protein